MAEELELTLEQAAKLMEDQHWAGQFEYNALCEQALEYVSDV
jgi:hypothetical protein